MRLKNENQCSRDAPPSMVHKPAVTGVAITITRELVGNAASQSLPSSRLGLSESESALEQDVRRVLSKRKVEKHGAGVS